MSDGGEDRRGVVFRGRGIVSSLLNVRFDSLESSESPVTIGGGGGGGGGDDCNVLWPNVPGCCWRPEERAMICSCLAADGGRSKCNGADGFFKG